MDLEEAIKLKVGDRVVFEPITQQDEYLFSSNIMNGQSETLIPSQEYFISGISYVGKEHVIARSLLFNDNINQGIKDETKDIWIQIHGIKDGIIYENFNRPQLLSFGEAIADVLKFGKRFDSEQLTIDEMLSVMTSSDNIGDMELDGYLEYLDYAVSMYLKPISFDQYESWGPYIPEASTISEEYQKFKELMIGRADRHGLDAEFVKYMKSQGARNYYDLMMMLQEGNVPIDRLNAFYLSGILRKEDWLISACYGSEELYETVLADGVDI